MGARKPRKSGKRSGGKDGDKFRSRLWELRGSDSLSQFEQLLGLPRSRKVGLWFSGEQRPDFDGLKLIAEKTGTSVDWLMCFDVARDRSARTVVSGSLTREQLDDALHVELERCPLAQKLGQRTWQALESLGQSNRLLERLTDDAKARVERNARMFIADRLDRFASVLEKLRPYPRQSLQLSTRRTRRASAWAQQWRIRALAVRQADRTEGDFWRYLQNQPAEIIPGELRTRFAVPGAVAWGERWDNQDEVVFFGEGFDRILIVRRSNAYGLLLRYREDDKRPRATDFAGATERDRRADDDAAASPPQDTTVLYSFYDAPLPRSK